MIYTARAPWILNMGLATLARLLAESDPFVRNLIDFLNLMRGTSARVAFGRAADAGCAVMGTGFQSGP
jgi:hypothetical protein